MLSSTTSRSPTDRRGEPRCRAIADDGFGSGPIVDRRGSAAASSTAVADLGGRMGGATGLTQRLAALARRPSALLPQALWSPAVPQADGDRRPGYDPELHGGLRQERGLPGVVDPARAGRRRLRGGRIPSCLQALRPGLGGARSPGWSLRRGLALATPGPGRSPSRSLLVPALRLDRLPDQLRGVRDAAVPAGHPARAGRRRGSSAATWSAGGVRWWLVVGGADGRLVVLVHLTGCDGRVAPAAALAYAYGRSRLASE